MSKQKRFKQQRNPSTQQSRPKKTKPSKGQKERIKEQRVTQRIAHQKPATRNDDKLQIDKTLPIAAHRQEIIDAVNKNQVAIITAETGSGKSTQVPVMLLMSGYEKVTIAVSSRTAAISLATRVASQTGSQLGKLVGYETGYEKSVSRETRILYTTQGLQLMHELHHSPGSPKRVLIIDECQEWSIYTETLVAWTKRRIADGWKSKVLLMSASADTEALSKFFQAPVVHSGGRKHDITLHTDEPRNILDIAEDFVGIRKNVLVFVPGKREIDEAIQTLQSRKVNACILPLHGDLTIDEQQLVYEDTKRPKIIVATNVAQTSITIPDIYAVVDTGLERSLVDLDGLPSLVLRPISLSDLVQRMGRAGRTGPGQYVYCGNVPINELEDYPTPDIYSEPIDNVVLRLATVGIDAHNLEWFHQPPFEKIEAAQKTLRILGAFDENNQITECGHIMAALPVTSQHARMLVEAAKRDVLADVVIIAAILEFGGLKLPSTPYSALGVDTTLHSDLLAELDVFNRVRQLTQKGVSNAFSGVNKRNFQRVLELRSKLYDVLYELYGDVTSSGDRQEILMSCATGYLEHLYVREGNNWYANPADIHKRKLDLYSLAFPTKYTLGVPRNLSLTRRQDGYEETLYLITHAIGINSVEALKNLAPHLVHTLPEEKFYDVFTNTYYRRTSTAFGDVVIEEELSTITDRKEQVDLLATWLAENTDEFGALLPPELAKTLEYVRANYQLSDSECLEDFYRNILINEFNGSVPNLTKKKSVHNLRSAIKLQEEVVYC